MIETQVNQISIEIAEKFYRGKDQEAWELVIIFTDLLLEYSKIYPEKAQTIFKSLDKVYTYKESLNYTLIADVFMHDIGRFVVGNEEK